MIEYELGGFKAFPGLEAMPIRPITLIYGQNSSGKSSILQSLLLLKQTLDESESSQTSLLPKGGMVDLGGYREFINKHDTKKQLSVKVVFGEVGDKSLLPPWLDEDECKAAYDLTHAGLRFRFAYNQDVQNAELCYVDVYLGNCDRPVLTYKNEKATRKTRNTERRIMTISPIFDRPDQPAVSVLKLHQLYRTHEFWEKACSRYVAWAHTEGVALAEKAISNAEREIQRITARKGISTQKRQSSTRPYQDDKTHLADLEQLIEEMKQRVSRFKSMSRDLALEDFETINADAELLHKCFLPAGVVSDELPFSNYRTMNARRLSRVLNVYDLKWLTLNISAHFNNVLSKLVYLGPLRERPERYYILTGNQSSVVGKSGKWLPDVLSNNEKLVKQVNKVLCDMQFDYALEIASRPTGSRSYSAFSDVFALRLRDQKTRVNVGLSDVGFGISQVLPILVQAMLSRDKVLLIEQPEIHLHPRQQAELGSVFAQCIGKPYSNKFIIETHSEHLMLRLQKLIRNGQLSPEQVSVIYVDRGPKGSTCRNLRLDKDGDFIDPWPGGFFEDDFREVFD